MLIMKTQCERCRTELHASGVATICSFECTFCPSCAQELQHLCPNCAGELVARPRRAGAAAVVGGVGARLLREART